MSLLKLAIQKVEELATTPVPYTSTVSLWESGGRKAMLQSDRDGLSLILVANGKCSRPLAVGYITWLPDGSWRWAVSQALAGLPGQVLGKRVNTPDTCYAAWVEDTKKRLGV